MNIDDPEVVATAATLELQYGDDAEVIATLRAAEYAAAGDAEAHAFWEMVMLAVAQGNLGAIN